MNLTLLQISCCLLLCSFCCSTIYAQDSSNISKKYPKNSKVLYRTIQVREDISHIVVNIDEEQSFEYDYWKGDAILLEQEIQLENAPNSVFNELMRKKRYKISESFQANSLVLQYEGKNTEDLRVNYKDVNEKVYLKLLIPEKMNVELKRKI